MLRNHLRSRGEGINQYSRAVRELIYRRYTIRYVRYAPSPRRACRQTDCAARAEGRKNTFSLARSSSYARRHA